MGTTSIREPVHARVRGAVAVTPRAAASVVAMAAVFAATIGGFVIPWRGLADAGDALPVSKYVAFEDGTALLVRRTDAGGELIDWRSVVTEIVPGLRAIGDLPPELQAAVTDHVVDEGADAVDALADYSALASARVGLLTRRSIAPDGEASTSSELRVLDAEGLHVLGFTDTAGGVTRIVPGITIVPADPVPGSSWSRTGTFGSAPYRFDAEVTESGPAETAFGILDDCVTITSVLEQDVGEAGADRSRWVDQWCATVGYVGGSTGHGERSEVVTTTALPSAATGALDLPPPAGGIPGSGPAPAGEPALAGDPSDWELTRVGSAGPHSSTGAATFAPVRLGGPEPAVLVSTDTDGDLVALASGEGTELVGTPLWRIPTGGAVYGPPAIDPESNRIFVGASDGLLRALDARGVFLWSVAAGDNIATRPVVTSGTVVFASEDATAYGVDVADGAPRWEVELDGAAVASPVQLDGAVLLADETGTVRALDPGDGAERWRWVAGGPVEVALVEAPGGVLIADRHGKLVLLGANGDPVWTADAGWTIRTEPTIAGDVAVVADTRGALTAVGLSDGSVRWRRSADRYVGAAGDDGAVIAARADGIVEVLGPDGEVVHGFDLRDAMTPGDLAPTLTYGPSVAGGAVWIADDRGVLRRIGPPRDDGPGALDMAWAHTITDPALAGELVVSTILRWEDRGLLVDRVGNLYSVDESGGLRAVGQIADDGAPGIIEGVVTGDLLVVDTSSSRSSRLVVHDLAADRERWSVPLAGQRMHPPVVVGDVVVAVSANGSEAVVEAYDLESGRQRWSMPTGEHALRSGPVAAGGTVFIGDPVVAVDPLTGAVQWTSEVTDPAGRPLVVDGMLVVAAYDGGEEVDLAAIDTATGATRWSRSTADGPGPASVLVATDGGTVAFAALTGPVVAFDARSGDELWSRDLGTQVVGSPAVIDGRIWVALATGIVALDPAAGEVELSTGGLGLDADPVGLAQQPAAIGDVVVIATGGVVYGVQEPEQ